MDAKKHPALMLVTLGVLGLASLAGVVLAGIEYGAFSQSSSGLAAADHKVGALLTGEPVALTKDNVERAQGNLDRLNAAESSLREALAGNPAVRFDTEFKGDPGELGSIIKESVERWRTACRDAGVRLMVAKPEDFAFGFSRYFQTGVNPQKSLKEIHRQTKIVDFLVKTLLDSKLTGDLRLVSVEREPIELPPASATSGRSSLGARDEVTGLEDSVLRREGLVRSEFYRVRFVARTETLRRFVNAVTDSGRAIALRGIDIVPATPELLATPKADDGSVTVPGALAANAALPAGLFGDTTPAPAAGDAAPAAPAVPEVVVRDDPFDITVTLEFIEPVKAEASAPAAENANK